MKNENLFGSIEILGPESLENSLGDTTDNSTTDGLAPVEGENGNEVSPLLNPDGSEIDVNNTPADNTGSTVEDDAEEEEVEETSSKSKPQGLSEGEVEQLDNNTPAENDNIYKALIKDLAEKGIITGVEEDELSKLEGSTDTILDLVNKSIDARADEKDKKRVASYSTTKKRFLEIEDAFTEDDKAIEMAQRLEYLDKLSEDKVVGNEELQKQLYYEHLTSNKKFSHEEALEALDDASKVGKLEEKALASLEPIKTSSKEFVESHRAKKAEAEAANTEAQTKAFEKLMESIDTKESFIDGLNITPSVREKMKAAITAPVYTDPKTGKEYNALMNKQRQNPAEFEMLLNYYETLGFFDMDKEGKFKPNIDKLKKVSKTKAVNELDRVISRDSQRELGQGNSSNTNPDTEGLLSGLRKAFNYK